MAQVTSTLVLPYNLIERTYLWYSLEIWISIFLLLCISTYLLYEAWRGYEKHSNAIATKWEIESIENYIAVLRVTQDREEFCRITRRMFELKYGHKLISGRSIFSQKLPPEMRNILLLVEAYEYKNKSSTDTTREEIRSVVLTHFK